MNRSGYGEVRRALTQWIPAPRAAARDVCLFAIGDIHGHAVELEALHSLVLERAAHSAARRKVLVYLGDYIDRGPAIRETVALLCQHARIEDGLERVFLCGNHDRFVVELLNPTADLDRAFFTAWLDNGGESTLRQVGAAGYGRLAIAGDMEGLSRCLRDALDALGADTAAFFNSLRMLHREDGYVFVHAGIDPVVALDRQEEVDLLLMREPFLSGSPWLHDFCVVHGHSISMPRVLPHRISVDAGCYKHGALCAVQIEGDRLCFLGVTQRADLDWARDLRGRESKWAWQSV